jgi:tRNA (guanine37-N1)-methyltransferase
MIADKNVRATRNTTMHIDVITIFPELFAPFVSTSLLGRAVETGMLSVKVHYLRDWTTDRHHVVDDTPFGGGGGMVLMAEPIVAAVESLLDGESAVPVVVPTARGPRFDQQAADRLAEKQRLVFVCGHYKGIDERVFDVLNPERFSLGDFVLTGGEVAAMAMIDAVVRRIPRFIGNADSAADDSFAAPNDIIQPRLLGPAVYTRPAVFRGHAVPEVLISGHHARVREWRRQSALEVTRRYRPDLLGDSGLADRLED